jgi:hypothetical protein
MITLLYSLLIYILFGAITYLTGIYYSYKKLTLFQQELFLLLGWIFKPINVLIILIDGYIIPSIKQKRAIKYINKQYNKALKNSDLSDEERKNIIHKRDTLISYISNLSKSEPDEYEE